MASEIYHHGQKTNDGFLVQVSKKSKPVLVKLPVEKINTIEEALAVILNGNNRLRVSGFKCESHNKFHTFMFATAVSVFPNYWGFDKKVDVIDYAHDFLNKE